MTPEPAVGVALDRALAERLGWVRVPPEEAPWCAGDTHWQGPHGEQTWRRVEQNRSVWCEHFGISVWSTDVGAALGDLADAMRERGLFVDLMQSGAGDQPWYAVFGSINAARMDLGRYAATPAEAIARAALAALDGEATP